MYICKYVYLIEVSWMRPYLITAKLMRPSNMKRFPTPALASVQTSSGAHAASYTMGTEGKSAAGEWRWPLTPIYCRGREWVGAIPPPPPKRLHGV
jgi:hypothetical protein